MNLSRCRSDAPALRALHDACFPNDPHPAWSLGEWWVVKHNGVPVAFAGVQPSLRWKRTGYLVRAGVLPAYRGRGLQVRLLRVRERYARATGWDWLVTATLNNTASANSLIKAGFRLYEPTAPWLAEGALYWRKRIWHTPR